MSPEIVHQSQLPWNPRRPDTLVVCCVDGRWRHHVQDFVAGYLGSDAHSDILAVPGGIEPLTLVDLLPKDFNFLRRRLEALVRTHGTEHIVAIAHQDCAWYKEKKLGPWRLHMREHQLRDLETAARHLHELFPTIRIETYFARLNDENPPRVVFERV